MQPTLRTARLVLRPASTDDLDALHALWDHPDVRRYLFDDEPVSRARAADVLADCLPLAADGLGLWIVAAGDGAPAGCAGLLPTSTAAEYEPRLTGLVEPLVALHPGAWHRGYATEALRALVTHAFDALALPRLAAVVDVPNAASQRLVERLGFAPLGESDGPRHRMRSFVLERPASPA